MSFDTDDIQSTGVTKMFRVRFDRNHYSVPPRLLGQSVVLRANDDIVAAYLGRGDLTELTALVEPFGDAALALDLLRRPRPGEARSPDAEADTTAVEQLLFWHVSCGTSGGL